MRLLNIGMFNRHEGQESMRMALESISTYYEEYSFENNLASAVDAYRKAAGKFDVIFLHVQRDGVIPLDRTKFLHSQGVKIYNFTGDVRQPIPRWYHELAPYVTTLFSNLTDAEVFNSLGFKAHYFQVGYNEHYYNKDVAANPKSPEIVFMGNNYNNTFPLGGLRKEMVENLRKRYGNRFEVFGCGWGKSQNLNQLQLEEARIYRGCKIAINLSHFNLKRYSSDRLFRILACGTFCLTHRYKQIETEFTDGEDLVCFDSLNHLYELIDKYLELPEERHRIAMNGNRKCESEFTWGARMQQLVSIINSNG
jgi:glycosyltransferase involved in cell wall biosynthesis